MTWGSLNQTTVIPQVKAYSMDEDDRIRAGVALSVGKLIEGKFANNDVKQGINILGKLSQDQSSLVREIAIKSLGKINSELVISFLELALKDTEMKVVSAASAAIAQYKYYSPSHQEKIEKTLPKNSAMKAQNPWD